VLFQRLSDEKTKPETDKPKREHRCRKEQDVDGVFRGKKQSKQHSGQRKFHNEGLHTFDCFRRENACFTRIETDAQGNQQRQDNL